MLILWSAPTPALFERRRLRVPPGQQPLLPDRRHAARHDAGADAGQRDARREILFVKDRNPAQEHWTGRLLSADEARARTGIDTVLPTSQFEPFVTAMLSRRGSGAVSAEAGGALLRRAGGGTRQASALVLDPDRGVNDPLTPPLEFARQIRDRFVGFTVDRRDESVSRICAS